MVFWEVNSRHAGELSVFFHEKVNSALVHIGQTIETNIKSATVKRHFEVSVLDLDFLKLSSACQLDFCFCMSPRATPRP